MERHPNRESVIGLYLRDHLGTDKIRISENPSTLVIVFCIDDERGRLQHRLDVRHEVIADHDAEELENILDTQRVIDSAALEETLDVRRLWWELHPAGRYGRPEE